MCGMIYAQSFNGLSVNAVVWDQYQKQKSRGTEGFGVFNGQYTVKAALEKRMKRWFKKPRNATDFMLFHHRFPTSTVNTKKAAHPFNTGDYFGDTRYVLVHNGTIDNDFDLRKSHEDQGIDYQSVLQDGTFNDSEGLLWDFALYAEGKQDRLEAYGGIAFICIKMVNNIPEKMYFGRNSGRPLKLKRDDDGIMLSSEGEGTEIEPSTLYTYNYALKRLTTKYLKLSSFDPDWSSTSSVWNARSEYYGNAASGYTNRNNVCSTGSSYVPKKWDDYDADDDDYYLDDFGQSWYGDDARTHRWNDGRLDALYGDKHQTSESAYWEEVRANIQKASRTNASNVLTKPALVGDLLIGREPTTAEVEVRVFKELGKAEGGYGIAYWHIVARIEELQDSLNAAVGSTFLDRQELKLLTACMDAILNDANYDTEYALHPLWVVQDSDKKQLPLITEGSVR